MGTGMRVRLPVCIRPWHAIGVGAPGQIVIGGGLAAVGASGAVYAVDNGLSDSPCQIRFRRVRIARTMEESAGLTRLRKGAGDEGEGGRLPGGQGHDYRTA